MTQPTISQRSVTVSDGRVELRVQELGSGPALVYLHPSGGLAWDPFLVGLSRQWTVIAPELPGSRPGSEDDLAALPDLPSVAAAYIEGLRALGTAGAPVIGQSFGGMLAAEIAARAPALCSRLVLLDPIGGWVPGAPVADLWHTDFADLPALLFYDPASPAARAFFTFPEDPEIAQQVMAGIGQALQASGQYIDLGRDSGLFDRLAAVGEPVLLVWGEHDRLVPVEHAGEFAKRLRHARVEIVAHSGHIPQVEQSEATLALVRSYLG